MSPRRAAAVTIIGSYRLPAQIGVSAGCLGKSLRIELGGHTGRVRLPRVTWGNDLPSILAPVVDPAAQSRLEWVADNSDDGTRDPSWWGTVPGWNINTRKIQGAFLSAIVCEFRIPSDAVTYGEYLHGRGQPQGSVIDTLFDHVDSWFDCLRTWVEAVGDQDADPSYPIRSVLTPGDGLQVFTKDGDTVSIPRYANRSQVFVRDVKLLTLPLLRKLAAHANSQTFPSDAHLLLRDGRAQWRRGHMRRAVIDAGSAVEVVLAAYNQRVTKVNTRKATLGWYVNQPAIAASASLPPATQTVIVDVRNAAIHENRPPTGSEANQALILAQEILERLEPLPI
jgi:hypothetical protein